MSLEVLTGVGVGASLAVAAGMVASRVTRHRFWPPGERDWRWWTYVGLGCLATVGLLGAAYLDWNAFDFPRPGTLVAGGTLLTVGITGFLGATFDLGVKETSGMAGELRTGGYYRYTRNPQPVFLLATVDDARVRCRLCDDQMTVIQSHTRNDAFISRHFRHIRENESGSGDGSGGHHGGECPGESDIHLKMKSIAYAILAYEFPDQEIELEGEVASRWADVLLSFDTPCHPSGNGIAVEAQYRNHGKDIAAATEH